MNFYNYEISIIKYVHCTFFSLFHNTEMRKAVWYDRLDLQFRFIVYSSLDLYIINKRFSI